MNPERELPDLFDELADSHSVGAPPPLRAPEHPVPLHRDSRRSVRTVVAAAACIVLVVGGLVAVNSRGTDVGPADSPTPDPTTSPVTDAPPSTIREAVADVDQGGAGAGVVRLVRIEADAGLDGTTGVVMVFDADLPSSAVDVLDDPSESPGVGIGYTTQQSDAEAEGIAVCGDTHSFPPPGNRTVDLVLPSEWFDAQDPLGPETIVADSAAGKIVVCDPRDGVVQISIWGSASAQIDDVDVRVDANTITVDISPDPAPDVVAGLAIGDSVMLGATTDLIDAGFIVDATESRGFSDVVDLLDQLRATGRLGDRLVVSAGTNGPIRSDELDGLMTIVAAVPEVYVLTTAVDRPWAEPNNNLIRALPSDHPNVTLVDWATAAATCPGDCFHDDDIHLRPDGTAFYTQLINTAVSERIADDPTSTTATGGRAALNQPPATPEMDAMFGAQCLDPDADFVNTVPVAIDLTGIPTPVEETGHPIGPNEGQNLEYANPDDMQYWISVSIGPEVVGYVSVPLQAFDVDPTDLNFDCHPEVAIYDDTGYLIGGFVDGEPQLLEQR